MPRSPDADHEPPSDPELAVELLRMHEADQAVRPPPADGGDFVTFPSIDERMRMARTDVGNCDRLREIVLSHGWPTIALVGSEAADAAWLIAQHADRQLDFQREARFHLAAAVAAGDADPAHLAYLTDRIAMNEGRPQTYGTQIAGVDDAGGVPWPIEDAGQVDERRAAVGLQPLAEYVAEWSGLRPGPGPV